MKRVILIISLLSFVMTPYYASAQDKPRAELDAYEWDFGTIYETDGVVKHAFRLKNIGESALVIERVSVECGCLTPKFSKTPIGVGENREIEVAFDPKNFSGEVSKRVTVISGRRKIASITIRATVIPRERAIEELYPFELAGGVRCDRTYLPLGYVWNGHGNTSVARLYNSSARTVNISYMPLPADSRLHISSPRNLAPSETCEVLFTLDLTDDNDYYGVVSETVYAIVEGEKSPIAFTVMAVAVDDFSLRESRGATCVVSPVTFDFGKVDAEKTLTGEFTITNTGLRELIVRRVDRTADTSTDLEEGTVVEPGESITRRLSFVINGADISRANGSITIITNDSQNPLATIRCMADTQD